MQVEVAQAAIHSNQSTPEFMTRADVRRKFGISDMTLHRWLKAGSLPAPFRGVAKGRCYWTRAEIDAFAARRAG